MACTAFIVSFIIWTILQFGPRTVLLLTNEAIRTPVEAIQFHLDSAAEHSARLARSIGRGQLPAIGDNELRSTVAFSKAGVDKLARHEANILSAQVSLQHNTPDHGHYVDSYPSTEALDHAKETLVMIRATQYIANKHCARRGIGIESCAAQISRVALAPTWLGEACARRYRVALYCSERADWRTVDGSCNNPQHPAWGASGTAYARLADPAYEDRLFSPRGGVLNRILPSPRLVSTSLVADIDTPDTDKTMLLLLWGQMVAHDMGHTAVNMMVHSGAPIVCCSTHGRQLSPRHQHPYCAAIPMPASDPFYGPHHRDCMSYVRSIQAFRPDCNFGPAEQLNEATHFLDGSVLYGSRADVARSIRRLSRGRLASDMLGGNEYPPSMDQSYACRHNITCHRAGDSRMNANAQMSVLHTILLREHNRLADRLGVLNAHWSDERLYQEARRIVVSQIQHITYAEWLPIVMGRDYAARPSLRLSTEGYSSVYDPSVNAAVSNEFATAAMRFVNSLVEANIGLYEEDRVRSSQLTMREADAQYGASGHVIDKIIRGMATQSSQKMDLFFSEAVTGYLYSVAGPGLDILSLDIQRGRDHGLPGYNTYRQVAGIDKATSFHQLTDVMPAQVVIKLKSLYKAVDDIDLVVGGLAEESPDDGLLGPTLRHILAQQFARTRAGDRFFYDNPSLTSSFTEAQLHEIKKASLSRLLCDNSDNVQSMQRYAFWKPTSPSNNLVPCSETKLLTRLSLEPWREMADPRL